MCKRVAYTQEQGACGCPSYMLQGDKCGVWQHSLCVGVDTQQPPDRFFCEWCRVSLADPFWEPRQRAFFPAAALRPVKGQPPAYLTPGEQVRLAVITSECKMNEAFRVSVSSMLLFYDSCTFAANHSTTALSGPV